MANALSSSKVTILRMGFELTSVRRAFYLIVQPSHHLIGSSGNTKHNPETLASLGSTFSRLANFCTTRQAQVKAEGKSINSIQQFEHSFNLPYMEGPIIFLMCYRLTDSNREVVPDNR